MFCPTCGSDAGDAKFCPECGADLSSVRAARGTSGTPSPRAEAKPAAPASGSRLPRTPLLVIGLALVAAIVVVVVIVANGHGSPSASSPSTAATAPAQPSLSGSYATLVERGQQYFNKGMPYVDKGDFSSGAPWFAAAAKVLQAAWDKQPGDVAVGSNLANSLFYAGNIQGAIKQIDKVLVKSPSDQGALLAKANFENMAGQMDKQSGLTQKSTSEIDQARTLYKKAIAIDPTSAAGKEAAAQLKLL